jgi:hypothetical protein
MRLSPILTATLLAVAILHPDFARAADAPTMAAPAAASASVSGKAATTPTRDENTLNDQLSPTIRLPILSYVLIAAVVFAIILLPEYQRRRKIKKSARPKDASPWG